MNNMETLHTIVQLMGGLPNESHNLAKPDKTSVTDDQTLLDIKKLIEKIWLTLEIATKDILNHTQAARFLDVSESELYQKASRKEIHYSKPGKFNYYKKEDLINYKLQNPQN